MVRCLAGDGGHLPRVRFSLSHCEVMLRGVIAAILLVAIAVITATVLSIAGSSTDKLHQRARADIETGKEIVRLSNRVNDYSLMYAAESLAGDDALRDAIQCQRDNEDLARRQVPMLDPASGEPMVDESGQPMMRQARQCATPQHRAVLNVVDDWMRAQSRQQDDNAARFLSERELGASLPRNPSVVIVADANGQVIARGGSEWADWYGEERVNVGQFPLVARSIEMGLQHGLIPWRNHATEEPQVLYAASAPVEITNYAGQREVVGSVLYGFRLANADVDDRRIQPAVDVAFFAQQEGQQPVISNATFREVGAIRDNIASAEFFEVTTGGDIAESASSFEQIASSAGMGKLYRTELNGESFLVATEPFLESDLGDTMTSGFLVMTSLDQAASVVSGFQKTVPLVAGITALLGLALLVVVMRAFLNPIDDINRGVQEVIGGNHSYMWSVNKNYFADLAHNLNVMSARLQGKSDPDSDGPEHGGDWQGMIGKRTQATRTVPPRSSGVGGLRGRMDDEQK